MAEIGARPLILVCAGAQASEVASYLRTQQLVGEPVAIRGFIDDHRFEPTFEGDPLLGGIEQLAEYLRTRASEHFWYVATVRDNRTRAAVVRRIHHLEAPNLTPWTARHVSALIGDAVQIGIGSRIGPGAIVSRQTTMGDHCVLDANCTISHDVELGAFVNIGPGASICGGVRIEEGCSIGAGATVVDGVHIGAWSVVGPGATVSDDVPAHVTVAGIPARIVQRHGRGLRHSALVS
jgi:sugar O-acyltransferase (sialic acid O-acetyltransferase NeuD family)